jgi:hypothetical protein
VASWMKVETVTPDKPEIAVLARKLGVSQGDAFLEWFRVYRWADGVTCPGFVPNLSPEDADMLSGARPGTCAALASAEIGWLRCEGGIHFEKWERHNGKSAKARALETEKKRKQRSKDPETSHECPDDNGTESGPEQEESKRKNQLHKGNRKSNGKPLEPIDPVGRLPKETFVREGFTPDLSDVDWDRVVSDADQLGRKIPPITETDRRNWLRFCVLVQTTMSEAWLADGIAAVLNAKQTRKNRQAHLYAVLRSKAEDGLGSNTFAECLACIEVPKDVWKSGVLEIRK